MSYESHQAVLSKEIIRGLVVIVFTFNTVYCFQFALHH